MRFFEEACSIKEVFKTKNFRSISIMILDLEIERYHKFAR
jgi:hypothetical protein